MGSVDKFLCGCNEPNGLERLRYFPRQLLTADDMRAEQEYFREKQRRHNRLLHGWGVVCGLEVVLDALAGPLAVSVCPGYALGPFGDEIYVPEPVKLDLTYCARPPADPCNPKHSVPQPAGNSPLLVMIRYAECPTRPMRTLPAGCGCDETACEYSRVRDGFEIQCMLKPEKGTSAETARPTICETENEKRNKLPKCPPCPNDPWVVLATISLATAKNAGSGTLAANSIDNSSRRIVYSTEAIQEQVVECCCTDEHEENGPREPITVDFETPSLAGDLRRFINPYTASGVKFTAESAGFGDEAVGLVTNNARATSVCLPPESTRQFLAAGRTTFAESVGITWLKIKATLPDGGRPAPVAVTADIQTGGGATVRVQLFDESGALLGAGTETATSEGKCPNAQGGDRGRATVTANAATGRVAYAIVDEVSGGIIFIIDAFKVT